MTYQVLDFYENINKKYNSIEEERKGIFVKIDFSETEPVTAIAVLKDIIEKIDRNKI